MDVADQVAHGVTKLAKAGLVRRVGAGIACGKTEHRTKLITSGQKAVILHYRVRVMNRESGGIACKAPPTVGSGLHHISEV